MSTTSLFIEFLITGIQVAIWLTLIILSLFGTEWIALEKIKGFEALAAILLLPIVYPVGVFVDNLADWLLQSQNRKIREVYFQDESKTIMRLLTLSKNNWLISSFEYGRVRVRICRSTALNFFLITIFLPIFTITRLHSILGDSTWRVAVVGFLGSALITIFALWSWQLITHTLFKRLRNVYEFWDDINEGN